MTLTKFDDDGDPTIMAIAATDREKKTVTVPVGEYMLTSNYLQEEYFEIAGHRYEWYNTAFLAGLSHSHVPIPIRDISLVW